MLGEPTIVLSKYESGCFIDLLVGELFVAVVADGLDGAGDDFVDELGFLYVLEVASDEVSFLGEHFAHVSDHILQILCEIYPLDEQE